MEHRNYQITKTGKRRFENRYVDGCRFCQGSGMIAIETDGISTVVMCSTCQGTGEVEIIKKIEVFVKPFNSKNNDSDEKTRILA